MMHGHSLVLPCYNTCHGDPLGLQVEKRDCDCRNTVLAESDS